MTLFTRSILALTLSLSLFACSEDDKTPLEEEPLKPLPAQKVSLNIGDISVDALQESILVTSVSGDEQLVNIETFKGLKYATAARFSHSEVTQLDDGVDATAFGDSCPQNVLTTQPQSEDCLNINIWRPVDTVEGQALPVYLFIHGGSFETGSGADLLIQGDNVVAQGASDGKPFIAVTFNYRLGLLGSTWVDDSEGGNFGLGDQKRALQWLNENITDFGGDASNVTLMGQGAGAMSVGILQQTETEEVVTENYFQRAIMQSNPYGFEYRGYDVAKSFASDLNINQLKDADSYSLEEVLVIQEGLLDPISKVINWVTMSLDNILFTNDKTPMSALMPFSPYVEYRAKNGILKPEKIGYHFKQQPAKSEFTVPTVLGVNSEESNSFGMLPSLTFLIPTVIELIGESNLTDLNDPEQTAQEISDWLVDEKNKVQLRNALSSPSTNDLNDLLSCLNEETTGDIIACVANAITLPSSAYEAVTKLFFGLGNSEMSDELLGLADFYPKSESGLEGALANMSQFKQLNNDLLFSGPSRLQAQQAVDATSLYYFAYHSSFNVWSYDLSNGIGGSEVMDIIKSIGCISGACNGSELPFVFNKAFKLNGKSVSPSTKDKLLMSEMSRLWFSDELFTNNQYNTASDNVLTIDTEGKISTKFDWDKQKNEGIDQMLYEGRLDGLNNLGLMLGYMD